jgi:hypothetical protein
LSEVKPGSELWAGDMGKVGELGLSEEGGGVEVNQRKGKEKEWLVGTGEGRKGGELR